jgi:hypothetical protein
VSFAAPVNVKVSEQGAMQFLYDEGVAAAGVAGIPAVSVVDAFHFRSTRLAEPPELVCANATCEPS